jgi:heavy metal sensor kinase
MKSIRLSLVVYFLLLLIAVLGAVSWFVHQLAAGALDERYKAAQDLVRSQYAAHCSELQAGFDRRVLRQAHYVAAMSRTSVHVEAAYPAGLIGVAMVPQPHLHVWLWLNEGIAPPWRPRDPRDVAPVAEQLYRFRSTEIDVEAAEDLIPPDQMRDPRDDEAITVDRPPDHTHEFFQVFFRDNTPISRSRTLVLANYVLPVDGALLKNLIERQPHERFEFDTLDAPGGMSLRRVTLVSSLRRPPRPTAEFNAWAWTSGLRPGPNKGGSFGKGGGPGPGPAPFMGRPEIPIFVQYAIDRAPTEARLQQYADERDQQLAQLAADTPDQLQALQRKLLWIALATFAATLAGGYLLLRLGLAPIGRLSEAVSEVSERDFRLNLDLHQLPTELQPIAERLSQTLGQLGRAFDREKQAAADISHELRTPLAALLTTIEVALRKARSAQEYREILEECRSSGQQMSHMVERLLALARLDAGAESARPRLVDAGELALGCADLIRPLARAAGLTLTAHVEPPLPAEVDPDKLREVVTNLLHNAVEYNRPGGAIELSVERSGDELCIAVRDTGIGIAPEARAHIFERFYRADPSRHADTPHAGLGLAIVKSYVDLLGGTIAVESVPQAGTTFRIRLPVPEAAHEARVVMA